MKLATKVCLPTAHHTPLDVDWESRNLRLEIGLIRTRLLNIQHDNTVCSFQYGEYNRFVRLIVYRMHRSISSHVLPNNPRPRHVRSANAS